MNYPDIITIEPGIRSGKPCIRGMRIPVSDVLSYLASGMAVDENLSDRVPNRRGASGRGWTDTSSDQQGA